MGVDWPFGGKSTKPINLPEMWTLIEDKAIYRYFLIIVDNPSIELKWPFLSSISPI